MKLIFTFIAITFLLIPLRAQEKVYTVDNLPKVHLQNKTQYVCNPAGILSKAACDSIDSMLYALELQTGIETVVAVASSLKQVAKCQLPMLFIHGDKDTYVPTWMVYPLYEAKPEPKELWIVPGAAHALSYKENKQEYTDKVRKFVGQYIH